MDALIKAIKTGNYQQIKDILSTGVNPNIIDNYYYTPLYYAASNGHQEVVKLLITVGADVNIATYSTSLHYAASNGHQEVVKILLAAGANVNDVDVDKNTPLHNAAVNGNNLVVEALLAAGANVNAINTKHDIPLNLAARYGHPSAVKTLLASGSHVNTVNWYDDTPLNSALQDNHQSVINMLIDAGGKINRSCIRRRLSSPSTYAHNKITIIGMVLGVEDTVVNITNNSDAPLYYVPLDNYYGLSDVVVLPKSK
jgi:ankyrin repeat protein